LVAVVGDHQTFCITVLLGVVAKGSKSWLSDGVKKVAAKKGLKVAARRVKRIVRKVQEDKVGGHFGNPMVGSDRGLCAALGSELPPYVSKGGFKNRKKGISAIAMVTEPEEKVPDVGMAIGGAGG
jgi:hypothetical protein